MLFLAWCVLAGLAIANRNKGTGHPSQFPLKIGSNVQSNLLIDPDAFEDWITWQAGVAFEGILANIGGSGSLPNVMPGTCVASPSTFEPDYFYLWTRDSAISLHTLMGEYIAGGFSNDTLGTILKNYINSSYQLQRTINPSGDFNTGGLGEPKFEADGSPFTGSWGRPQRDGPALRALGLIEYIDSLIQLNGTDPSTLEPIFFNVVKPDLDYTVQNWNSSGFDLWEEIDGFHFFTASAQYLALSRASSLLQIFAAGCDDGTFELYKEQASLLGSFIESFYDDSKGFIVETPSNKRRDGLDTAIPLAMQLSQWAHNSGSGAKHSDSIAGISVDSPHFVATLCTLIDIMAGLYPLNSQRLAQFPPSLHKYVGVAVGRYPEDIYDGVSTSIGNPWFLCTASIAHNLYLLAQKLVSMPSNYVLHLTSPGGCLYTKFIRRRSTILPRSEPEYMDLVNGISQYADSFLDVIREHRSYDDGAMSEQFSRYNGYMKGAPRLTWSYSAFYDAVSARSALKKMILSEPSDPVQ